MASSSSRPGPSITNCGREDLFCNFPPRQSARAGLMSANKSDYGCEKLPFVSHFCLPRQGRGVRTQKSSDRLSEKSEQPESAGRQPAAVRASRARAHADANCTGRPRAAGSPSSDTTIYHSKHLRISPDRRTTLSLALSLAIYWSPQTSGFALSCHYFSTISRKSRCQHRLDSPDALQSREGQQTSYLLTTHLRRCNE